jgi:hypothetical protein
MREIRLSGSVEGAVSNHSPYSDSLFRGLVFSFILALAEKNNHRRQDRGQGWERGRPQEESKLTDNMLHRWREGCIPRRTEEPAAAGGSVSGVGGRNENGESAETHRQSTERSRGKPEGQLG